MKKFVSKYIPLYGIIPVAAAVIFNMAAFYGSRLVFLLYDACGREDYFIDISVPAIDDFFSSVTADFRWFIIIYIFSYVFWFVGFVLIARDSKENCYWFFGADVIGKTICFLFFILMPTMLKDRPVVEVRNVFDWMTQFIYSADPPNNLFPSLHCYTSWMVFRGSMRCDGLRPWYKVYCLVLSVLIFLSTLFVKQHVFLDVVSGILLAELVLFISKKANVGRMFSWLNKKCWREDLD